MAKLNTFSRDGDAMRNGEWVNPGTEYGGIQIRTRALGAAYADARAGRLKRAAREAGREDLIGQAEKNRIDIEALCETCLLDVRGLQHDDAPDGTPGGDVTIAEFKELILKDEHAELALLAFLCAQMVGQKRKLQAEIAAGN